jgi:4-hydroxybenzoate polyprenyltransferase
VLDLARTRQALLSVAQPALGAVLALGALPSPRVAAIGLIAAVSGFLAVFSLNDVLDRRVDARALALGKAEFEGYDIDTVSSRHPLASGMLSRRFAYAWVGTLGAVSAFAAWTLAPACLALFGVAVALEALYCSLRSVTWLKTFVSGLMVGVGGLAGWAAVAPLSLRAAPFFGFLVLWEIAGRNIPNDLADIEADARTGITTISTVFGERAAAWSVLSGSAATVVPIVMLAVPTLPRMALLLLAMATMVLPAFALVGRPLPEQAARYFNRASLLPALMLPLVILAAEVHW